MNSLIFTLWDACTLASRISHASAWHHQWISHDSATQDGCTFSHRWSLVHHASFLPTRYIFPWSTPSSSPHSDFYNLPYPMSISDSTSIMNALQGFFRSLLSNHGNMEMVINTGEEGCLLTSCLKKSTSQLCLSENPCFTV